MTSQAPEHLPVPPAEGEAPTPAVTDAAAPAEAEATAAAGAQEATAAAESAAPAEGEAPAEPEAPAEGAPAKAGGRAAELSPAQCAAELSKRFPALFGRQPKPLKLRIQADIQQRAPGVFSKRALSIFLHRHTGSTSYLIALSKSKERFDLDGQPAGELSEEHRNAANEELARRRANQQTRREQEEQGRRDRADLLWAFEHTTLTPANFCALKGIAPESLDSLLEVARKEAAERAAQPPRREGFGGRGGDRGGERGGRAEFGSGRQERGPGGRPDRGPGPSRPEGGGGRPGGGRPGGRPGGGRPGGGKPGGPRPR